MSERQDEFDAHEARVVVVTFAPSRTLAGYRRRFAPDLTVVSDEDRLLYRALGFGRGSISRVWGLRAAMRYAQLMMGGHRVQRLSQDTLQLGGDVVIDASGRLVWVRGGAGPDDRPDVVDILTALAAL